MIQTYWFKSSSSLLRYFNSLAWMLWNALSQLSKYCDINTWFAPLPITLHSASMAFSAAEQLVAAQGPTGAGGRTRKTVTGLVKEVPDCPGCVWPPWAELGLDPVAGFGITRQGLFYFTLLSFAYNFTKVCHLCKELTTKVGWRNSLQ